MKCPQCLFDNPEEINFCGQCGAKLIKFCPSCKNSNPPRFRYCGNCGDDLSLPTAPGLKELSFDEK